MLFPTPSELPGLTPFKALPGPPADNAGFPAMPWKPDMRLVVSEYSGTVSVMEDDGDDLGDNLIPGDVYRIVGQLGGFHI